MFIFAPEQVVSLFYLITIATLSNKLGLDYWKRPGHRQELKSSNLNLMNRDHFWEAKTPRSRLEDGALKERHIFEGPCRYGLYFV